ncbi:hypothetical protein AJ80_02320 [Polytolypa hystricis UAMH7299]|uniref:DNA damage-responsive protein 48 n=1 Tax=Polytolypa hystricis (strain UAMH7299) TaxID=1447883 RepID=A0A2B7YQU4_POLH7|nr:hypothetical protein AJ80_02320 [Polytolypa hystricis UAMH7299]
MDFINKLANQAQGQNQSQSQNQQSDRRDDRDDNNRRDDNRNDRQSSGGGLLSSLTNSNSGNNNNRNDDHREGNGGGFLSGLGDKLNSAVGGGKEAEKKEDMLDKGIDLVQEHILKQGKQDNESALEQKKDAAIAGFIRDKYKSATGSEFPVKEKR